MSVPHALEFIRRIREEEALRRRVAAVAHTISAFSPTERLIRLAAEHGLAFDEDEFQTAFRHDWRLRWLKHSKRHAYRITQEDAPAP